MAAKSLQYQNYDSITKSLNELSDDYQSMHEEGCFSDVGIICGAYTISTHKFILCTRCPVFKAMFDHPLEESLASSVSIHDLKPSVLREMLFFIYSGNVKNLTVPLSCELIYAAEKYQLIRLKNICCKHLKSNLSKEDAFHILKVADLCDETLKLDTLAYIADNFSTLEVSSEWKSLQKYNPSLAFEVCANVVTKLGKNLLTVENVTAISSQFQGKYSFRESLSELSRDYQSMYEEGHFADVNIKCGSDIMQAHKVILCARSPVFKAMFDCPMEKSVTSPVSINDLEPSVLRKMLFFIYSGNVEDLTVTLSCDLLYAADKYKLMRLTNICSEHLKNNLTNENSFYILKCAVVYDETLKIATLEYIANHFSILKDLSEWELLQKENPTLAFKVYSNVLRKLEKQKFNAIESISLSESFESH